MSRTFIWVVIAITIVFTNAMSARAAPAGSLWINANPGTQYGNRTFTNVVWGDGYPTVSVEFITDDTVVFPPGHGGGQKQRFANNGIAPGNQNNNNPAFTGIYTNTLRLNAMIADTGTVTTTYTFSYPMTLIDLILCDFDDNDMAWISATGPDGEALPPSIFEFIMEGDLSMTNNAGNRPPLELATPPLWNPVSGVLTSAVSFNENRSYTVLRVPEGVAVKTITITFTGYRADNDGPDGGGLGAHIYVNLWATPRDSAWQPASAESTVQWRIPTLPGVMYEISSSSNFTHWELLDTLVGPSAPTGHVIWTDATVTNHPSMHRMYRF